MQVIGSSDQTTSLSAFTALLNSLSSGSSQINSTQSVFNINQLVQLLSQSVAPAPLPAEFKLVKSQHQLNNIAKPFIYNVNKDAFFVNIYYGNNWQNAEMDLIRDFINNLAFTPWWQVLIQYELYAGNINRLYELERYQTSSTVNSTLYNQYGTTLNLTNSFQIISNMAGGNPRTFCFYVLYTAADVTVVENGLGSIGQNFYGFVSKTFLLPQRISNPKLL
jgi:hypothetical protein